jgi:hypothetical protein
MRYIPINGEPDGGGEAELDPRRRSFAGMFNAAPQMEMGGQRPIMMGDTPEIAPDAPMNFQQWDWERKKKPPITGPTVSAPNYADPAQFDTEGNPVATVGGAATQTGSTASKGGGIMGKIKAIGS